jgi:hypothetical protein
MIYVFKRIIIRTYEVTAASEEEARALLENSEVYRAELSTEHPDELEKLFLDDVLEEDGSSDGSKEDSSSGDKYLIFNEGGINWAWFTELCLHEDGTITILRHYRLHKGDPWSEKNLEAPHHPEYYYEQRWREKGKRIATHYNIPDVGWALIRNQKYIFDYEKYDGL